MTIDEFEGLPGAELVAKGLAQAWQSTELTAEVLLLAMATRRLGELGVELPGHVLELEQPEMAL